MKFLVVVLALAALCQAEPEADPESYYGNYYGSYGAYGAYGSYGAHGYGAYGAYSPYAAYRPFHARSGYGYALPGYGYTHVDRLHKREADAQFVGLTAGHLPLTYSVAQPAALPLTYSVAQPAALPFAYNNAFYSVPQQHAAFAPIAPLFRATPQFIAAPVAPVAAPIVPTFNSAVVAQPRPYTPYDCVTPEGCAVRTLKEQGLAKREATAEADADAEAEAYYYGGFPSSRGHYALSPYYNNRHFYGGYNNRYYRYGAHFPYRSYYNNYYNAPAYHHTLAAAAPLAIEAPLAVAAAIPVAVPAAPLVEVRAAPVLEAAPLPLAAAPVYHHQPVAVAAPVVQAAPLPFAASPFYHHQAVAVAQPARVAPVVEEYAKQVTYTHLGAHPIHPTTVLEKTSRVVGHHVY